MSSVRASSGVPWKTNQRVEDTSICESIRPMPSAMTTAIVGRTHSAPRMYSHNASRRTQTTLAVAAEPVNALIEIAGCCPPPTHPSDAHPRLFATLAWIWQ